MLCFSFYPLMKICFYLDFVSFSFLHFLVPNQMSVETQNFWVSNKWLFNCLIPLWNYCPINRGNSFLKTYPMTPYSLWLCVYLLRYLYGIRLGSSKECLRSSPGFLSKASSWSRVGTWDFPYYFKGETKQIFDFVAVASIYPLDYGNIGLFLNVYLFLKRTKNTIFKINFGSQKWSLWVMLLVH